MEVLDLRTGAHRTFAVPVNDGAGEVLVWSPDSRWLFAVGTDQRLSAIDVPDGTLTPFPQLLPALTQLAIRPAASSNA